MKRDKQIETVNRERMRVAERKIKRRNLENERKRRKRSKETVNGRHGETGKKVRQR